MRGLYPLVVVFASATITTSLRGEEPRLLSGHEDSVTSITFLSDGRVLASGSSDKSIRLWTVADGKEIATLAAHNAKVQAVAATRNGKRLASGDKTGVALLWDVETRKVLQTLKGGKGDANALAFSPDGKTLAVGGGGYDEKTEKGWGEIRLHDVAAGKAPVLLEGLKTGVTSLAFTPDGKKLASCSANGSVVLWDVDSARKHLEVGTNPNGASGLAISPDGKTIVCGSFVRSTLIKFWNTDTGKETRTVNNEFGPSTLSLAFLPGGNTLVVGGLDDNAIIDPVTRGGYIGLWDAASGKELTELKGQYRAVLCVAVSPGAKLIATGGLDRKVRVWELDEDFRKK